MEIIQSINLLLRFLLELFLLVIFGLAFAALYGRELRSLAWVLG
jgi:hypothetical protein